jgi:hypothetical protein
MEVCTVQADLSTMRNQLRKWLSENGTYWAVAFDVAITFGATELKSSLVWEDQVRPSGLLPRMFQMLIYQSQNKQRRGAATLIPSKFV